MINQKYYNFKLGDKDTDKNGKIRLDKKGNVKYVPKGLPKLITESELSSISLNADQDYYKSIYYYNTNHKEIIEKNKSVAGIDDVLTDKLVWDFDNEQDPEKSRLAAIEVCNRLVNKYDINPDHIGCYFSGNKGYHVEIKLNKEINVEEFKAAVNKIGGDIDTFDAIVFDYARVFRIPNSKNKATGLFKIPLTVYELDENSTENIKKLAVTTRDLNFDLVPIQLPEDLFKVKQKEKKQIINNSEDFDYSTPPRGWKKYKWALAQGHFESGERHNALMVIAATARGLGYSKSQTYYLCKAALKNQSARTGDPEFDKSELFENIIEKSVFSPNWDGGQYSPDNNPWLKKYCERMRIDITKDTDHIVQLFHIEDEFTDFVKNIDKNTILTGIPQLDEELPLTIGMNLGIIGAASSGKTAISLKILENTSNSGVVSVFASLDMRRNRLFEKLLYRVSGLSRNELYKEIQEGRAAPIYQKVRDKYKNVYFYDRSCPSVDDIRSYVLAIEEQTGQKVKLVMLDYFERVNAERSDDTAASKEVAGKLQDMVNDLNVCLITLVQPNKFALSSGPDSPILNYTSIKGSSYLYQAFRSIISIWRPFFTPELKENDKFLQMAILKNDLGELNMFNFGWDGKRGEIWGLGEEGEAELEKLMREKEQKKSDKNSDGGWE